VSQVVPAQFDTVVVDGPDSISEPPRVPLAYKIKLLNCSLDLYVHPKMHTKKIYVFSPGFMDRRSFRLPFFQRLRWFEHIEATGIILSDPTLALSETLGVTWFQGTAQSYFLQEVVPVLKRLFDLFEVPRNRVIFFGSSAGGFSSLMFAGHLPGTCAVVNNPQTNILHFQQKQVRALLDYCFSGVSNEKADRLYRERFCVASFYRTIRYLPNLIYVQNSADLDHYNNHLLPFLVELHDVFVSEQHYDLSRVVVTLYKDAKQKHNPAVYNDMKGYFKLGEDLFFDRP
jgi:hypothetical protein